MLLIMRVWKGEGFPFLGYGLGRKGGSDRALRSRTSAAWSEWKEVPGILLNIRHP